MLPWAFLKNSKFFYRKTDVFVFGKTQIFDLERFDKPWTPIISAAIYSKFATFYLFEKINFFREAIILFQETQTLNVFRSRTISVAFYVKFATSWLKNFSDTWSTNVGSLTRAHLANLGQKHELNWEEDFAFRILNLAENGVNERCGFCKFLSWKLVLDFFPLTSMKWILTKNVDSFNPQCLES